MSATAEDLKRRLNKSAPAAADLRARLSADAPSANFVARETFSQGIVNNVLAAPSATGDLLAVGSAAAQHFNPASALWRMVGKLRGQPEEGPTFRERIAEEKEKFPASMLRAIPRPTTNEITAAARSIPSLFPGGESPSEAYDRNLEDVDQAEFKMRDAHPTAAAVGDVAGDIASLFLARRGTGVEKAIQRFETRMSARESAAVAESLADDLGKVVTSNKFRKLARGAGRSVESGVEAAVLDILKNPDADPLEAAGVAAGAQMAGSGVLAAGQGLVSGGVGKAGINITVAAMTTWGFLQVLKSATPGGEDRILESMESGYDKVALALGLGAAAAGLGLTRYGRGNTNLSEQTRTFLDGISTAHRGTTLSLLNEWRSGDEGDRATIERVLTAVAEDPHYRGKNEAERRVVSMLRNRYRTAGGF